MHTYAQISTNTHTYAQVCAHMHAYYARLCTHIMHVMCSVQVSTHPFKWWAWPFFWRFLAIINFRIGSGCFSSNRLYTLLQRWHRFRASRCHHRRALRQWSRQCAMAESAECWHPGVSRCHHNNDDNNNNNDININSNDNNNKRSCSMEQLVLVLYGRA